MSLLTSDLPVVVPVAVGDWHPSRFTPSLAGGEDFPTQGDKLLPFVRRHWRSPESSTFQLDAWQEWLLRHVLEVYPPDWPVAELRGQLRFRQVVISLGRQNGKSVIGAILAFYYLVLHVQGPRVISCASVESQARIVYDRVQFAIDNNPLLKRELNPTISRGISRRDKTGIYKTMPAKEETAQGEPITGALYDELHLGLTALWDAIVVGQSAKTNSQLVGITTAGDDDSDLLIRLYAEGDAALAGQDERFGFFVWEAVDDNLTAANVIRANPSVACGRVSLTTKLAEAEKAWRAPRDKDGVTGKDRVIRYVLNRFVRGTAKSWAPLDYWRLGGGPGLPEDPPRVFYAIDRHEWEYATITAATKIVGVLHTEIVASLVNPSHEQLLAMCQKLTWRPGSAVFGVDAKTLGALGKDLKKHGLDVRILNESEMHQAAAATLSAINRRALAHAGDELMTDQMPKAKRRDTGDSWRVSRSISAGPIDAVIATIIGVYLADLEAEYVDQLL